MKKHFVLIIICSAVFIAAAVSSVVMLNASPGDIVKIKSNGELLYTIDLSKSPNRTIFVEYNGKENTLEIKDHKIRVLEADCPDKVCVNTGWLDSPAIPIICLPNKLIIEFENNDADAAAR